MDRRVRLGAALVLALAGCLEEKPGKSGGYLPDGGGPSAMSACPSTDARADVLADQDGATSDASADGLASVGAPWAGTWKFTDGQSGVTCPDNFSFLAAEGSFTIEADSSGGGGFTLREGACSFHFTVMGDKATSDCGQACSLWGIPTIPEWSLTMQSPTTLEEILGGRVPLNGETCVISGQSTLTRQ